MPSFIYGNVKYPSAYSGASEKGPGPKKGISKAQNIMGLIAVGDASVEAACKAGSISEVATVDHEYMSILGVYVEWSTIETGN